MRVVWISKSEWRKPGPIVYMGLLNALAFAVNGFATDFFCTNKSTSATDDDLRDYYDIAPHALLHIHRIDGTQRARAVYDAALSHIKSCCERGESVLVCTRELGCLPSLLALRKRFAHLRVLHEAHDYFFNLQHQAGLTWSMRRRQWSERLLLPRVDGLICLTEHQRALYQQYLPQQPMLALPLGCVSRAAPIDSETRRALRSVAYVGHLHSYKGLEQIFALAAVLAQSEIALHCFGGHAAQIESLRARAQAVGLSRWLHFTAFVAPRELNRILSHEMSIGLAPLQDTFYNRYLTCPVKILDFIGSGLPVVASDLPSTRALLGSDYSLCVPTDIGAFRDRITFLLDNAEPYAVAAVQSERQAKALQWSQRAAQICHAFAGDIVDPAADDRNSQLSQFDHIGEN